MPKCYPLHDPRRWYAPPERRLPGNVQPPGPITVRPAGIRRAGRCRPRGAVATSATVACYPLLGTGRYARGAEPGARR